jgi:hypothetical protein
MGLWRRITGGKEHLARLGIAQPAARPGKGSVMNRGKHLLLGLLGSLLCAGVWSAPAAGETTTATFTLVPQQSPVSVKAKAKYIGVTVAEATKETQLSGSFTSVYEITSKTLHSVTLTSGTMDFGNNLAYTLEKSFIGATVKVTLSLNSGSLAVTQESTGTLVDTTGSATISLHKIEMSADIGYDYKIVLITFPPVTIEDSGTKTVTQTLEEPFTYTTSPTLSVDRYTPLTAQYHVEKQFTQDLGDGLSVEFTVNATATGKYIPPLRPPAGVQDFQLYGEERTGLPGRSNKESEPAAALWRRTKEQRDMANTALVR